MTAIVFAILAGLCWGVGEVFTKMVLHTKQIGPITAVAIRSTVALPIMWMAYAFVVHAAKMEPATWIRADSQTMLRLILGSGLAAGAGGMIFFYLALNYGEISRVKPIAFALAPATAVILGALFLNETLTTRKLLAITLIIAGVILLSLRTSPKPA